MKILIVEATADELSANKRIADAIIDALVDIADGIARFAPVEEAEEEVEDSDNG